MKEVWMHAKIIHPDEKNEFPTSEGCFILELWNTEEDSAVSVARARLTAEIKKTKPHYLVGISERYLIASGNGVVHIEGLAPKPVGPGDMVVIPPGSMQWIENTDSSDLIFYCICTPRFTAEAYKEFSDDG